MWLLVELFWGKTSTVQSGSIVNTQDSLATKYHMVFLIVMLLNCNCCHMTKPRVSKDVQCHHLATVYGRIKWYNSIGEQMSNSQIVLQCMNTSAQKPNICQGLQRNSYTCAQTAMHRNVPCSFVHDTDNPETTHMVIDRKTNE